jgi:hypothetical protein
MKTGSRNAIIAIVIIAALIVGANQYGYVAWFPKFQTGGTSGGPTGGGQTIDSTMRSNYLNGIGQFEMNTKRYDSLVVATAYAVAQANIYYYHFLQGRWVLGVTASSGTDLFDAKPEDNGYMWAVIAVVAGQAFYVDYQKIMQNDPYIVGYQYVDVDGTGVKQFAFQYDLKNHAIPSSGYPVITFTAHLLNYAAPTFGSLLAANVTNIGATLNQSYFNWYLKGTANKGFAVYRVELIAGNSTAERSCTDLTKVALKKLQIPGLGYLDGSQFQQSFTSTDIRWTYTATTNFDHAIYLTLLANANNRFDMNCQIEFLIGTTVAIPITLTVYYLTAPSGSGASISESFYACLTTGSA